MGYIVIGVDEVGRGALAGPVVAAAVAFPSGAPEWSCHLRDSKKLSAKKRRELEQLIAKDSVWGLGAIEPEGIDRFNIRQATHKAMAEAAYQVLALLPLGIQVEVWIDGPDTLSELEPFFPQRAIPGGDDAVAEIAAASILAKVRRDAFMESLDAQYPGYDLGKHKGYGTKAHREAIATLGPSPVHRLSFRGVREYVSS